MRPVGKALNSGPVYAYFSVDLLLTVNSTTALERTYRSKIVKCCLVQSTAVGAPGASGATALWIALPSTPD